MINTYNLFAVPVMHGKLPLQPIVHKKILSFVDNNPHSHPTLHSNFSGVFYLSNENNNIIFTRGGETFSFQPKIFDFLIFPYHLVHYVLPEKRKEKRICYAFNLKSLEDKDRV